jgi:hypothetical protein
MKPYPRTYSALLARCRRVEAELRKRKVADACRQRAYYARKKAKRERQQMTRRTARQEAVQEQKNV